MKTPFKPAFAAVIISISVVAGAAAPSDRSDPLDQSNLPDLLAHAALHNAGLKAAHQRWRAAVERVPLARALPDPRLNYGWFARSVETRVGPQQHKVGVSQTFPWAGKRALRGEVAEREALALYEGLESAKLKLFHQVRFAWHELAYLRRAVEITEENIRLLKDLESVAQTKVQGGAGLAGVAKAQVELGKLEDRRRSLLDLRAPLTARLNAALNRPADAPFEWPRAADSPVRQLDEANLSARLAESNPELRGMEFETARNEKAVELARRDRRPDVTFGLDYTQIDRRPIAGLADNGKDPLMATFSINLPLWRKKYDAAERAAEASQAASEAAREDRANQLQADFKMAVFNLRDAERKIDLYRDTLTPLAEQSLSVARQSWEAGKADFLDVIDAERLLLEFRLQFERARSHREQYLSEVETLVGAELPAKAAEDAKTGGKP